MKEELKAIGKDVYYAGRLGFLVFLLSVSVGVAWKLGNIVTDKIEESIDKKSHKD